MSRRYPKPVMLPVLALAIVLPITLAVVIGGPGFGLIAGGLVAVVVVAIAIRSKPRGRIFIAAGDDDRRHVLLVVDEAVTEPGTVESVLERAGADPLADLDLLVLAPAHQSFLDRWATDVRRANHDAQRNLVLTIASLAAAGAEARGRVGDDDLLQATEDALRTFPADEVIVVTALHDGRDSQGRAVDELATRLPVRLEHLQVERDDPLPA